MTAFIRSRPLLSAILGLIVLVVVLGSFPIVPETKQAVASHLDPELRVDLDEPAREVRRAAAEALATEDVSEDVSAATPPSAGTAEPGNAAGTEPKPP